MDGGRLRVVLTVALAAGALAFPAHALAEQPFRLETQIEDRAGALDGRQGDVRAAIDELRSEEQIQLWVAYVESFSGVRAQEWAEQTAERSDLGLSDVLLAVATGDRAYAYSVDEQFPLSDSELARIADREVEPRLADGDWAGAAIAAAEAIGAAGGDAEGSDGGGLRAWPWLGLAAVVVLGAAGWWLLSRSRRRGSGGAPVEAGPEELAGLSAEELSKRGSSLLVAVDDAVKTSEQEVAFAAAQFGDEAAAPFAAAVEAAKADLAKAFALRRSLDDSTPEDEARRRAMLAEIVTLAQGASDGLDAEAERFDELRALERNAPALLAGLTGRLDALEPRLPAAEATLARLRATYAPTAVVSVADNIREAGERIAFARAEVAEGNIEVAAGRPGRAAVALRGAEEAAGQTERLLDAVDRLAADLADADDEIRSAIPAVVEDIAAARALAGESPELAGHVVSAEAALESAELAASTTDGQDPLGALQRLEEAGKALDAAVAGAREEQEEERRARAALDAALSGARARIEAADDFITTRRGAIGAAARTRLAEAMRHLDRSVASLERDPRAALEHARTADGLAEQALRLAQQDVAGYDGGPPTGIPGLPGTGGSIGDALGDMIRGGILIDILRGAGRASGGGGMRIPGGFGPGSFGGLGTRGRRGGGGRF